MNNLIFLANWKATKTAKETVEWVKIAKPRLEEVQNATIIVCPSFILIPALASLLEGTNIKIGAQYVSKFKNGAYTGEVTVEMLDSLVDYCIIGHSERRKYFGETDEDVIKKANLLLEAKITPVLCISNFNQLTSYIEKGTLIVDQAEKIIFVYEPPEAISTGGEYRAQDPEEVDNNLKEISSRVGKSITTLYGGSVNLSKTSNLLAKESVKGFLIGQASTDPVIFSEIISAATKNL